ncbi:MAG TPA: ASPIC/UnbV domain-containing protein [Verrucomicrobiae bacterium]
MTPNWGTAEAGVHQGISVADFDGDGDLDFVVNKLNRPARLYRNDSPAPRIAVRLRGRTPNRAAVGAKVRVRCAGLPEQRADVSVGGRYLSGFDSALTFAAGKTEQAAQALVIWPGGKETTVILKANHAYEIEELQ